MKTKSFKTSEVNQKWHLIDAENKTLGRLTSKVSKILMGKNKPQYTPNNDLGDYVIIINAEKIKLTGNKEIQKKYYRHSGFPGGLKTTKLSDLRQDKPEQIVIKAVKGMLPKNKLSNNMLSKLKVYKGSEHPHIGQNPELLET
tara:strand:+ start:59 stop:487 length:429 start_codon:yes stop_codon:yes gene_type:complete